MGRRLSYDKIVKRRVSNLYYFLAVAYLALIARLFYIQVVRAPEYKSMAQQLTVRRIMLPARRGTIYDRWGKKLAETVNAYDIAVRPVVLEEEEREEAAARLSPRVGWEREKLLEVLKSRRRYVFLKRQADVELGQEIKKLNIYGVEVTPTTKRIYPAGSLAAHIIGFTNIDGKGIEGLERAYDQELRGTDGYVIAEVDAKGRLIPGTKRRRVEPVNGKDLILTIDATMQHSLETELAKTYNDHSAAGASAVMLDPRSGEILALANMPTFDPNKVAESDAGSRRNRAVTDLYEPGSTLKAITACAALDEQAIRPDETFYCSGSMRIGRRTIRCSLHEPFMNGHGACNVSKMLCYSCNMAAAGIGLRLGKEKLHKYEEAFDLYDNPGTGLPGETRGWEDRWQDWADVRTANIAFGQGIVVTPMQMAKAYSAIANGGRLMRPFIIKEIRRPDGTPDKVFTPRTIRRVVSRDTADIVCKALGSVVTDGTAKRTAKVEGYTVAGKTGSAQKASTTGRGYAAGKFIASFVGFLPMNRPKVLILVAVDEPKGSHWGATVAAPVFRQVAKKAMWHFRVPPDDVLESVPPPSDGTAEHEPPISPSPAPVRPALGG